MSLTSSRRLWSAVASVADAGVSSVGNFVVSIAAARRLSLSEFGIFSALILSGYALIGLSRAVHAEPFILAHGGADTTTRHPLASRLLGDLVVTSTCVGVVLAAVAAAGFALGVSSPWIAGLAALALVLPLLLAQDFLRSMEYVNARPFAAFLNNSFWTGSLLLALVALSAVDAQPPLPAYIVAWGLSSGLGLAMGLVTTRLRPDLNVAFASYRADRTTRRRVTADFLLIQATAEGVLLLVGLAAGSTELGILRKAQLPLAPTVVVTSGLIAFLQPALVRRRARGENWAKMEAIAWKLGLAGVVTSMGLALAVWAVPEGLIGRLLGSGWPLSRQVVPWMGAYLSLGFLAASLGVAVRSLGRVEAQLRIRAVLFLPTLILVSAGAHYGGALGAAHALCLSLLIGVVAAAVVLRRAVRLSLRVSAR